MRVMFIGSKQLGFDILKVVYKEAIAVLTVDDRGDVRSRFDDIREFCSYSGIPFFVANNRAHSEGVIRQQRPDICFVVGWYWIIGEETLSSIPRGAIGVHNSLLPKYRGGSPLAWSVINGDDSVGFSVFSLTKGMDEGDIWLQGVVDVKQGDDIGSLLKKIEGDCAGQIKANYKNILSGKISPVPQDHTQATYCARRIPSDGIIDWTLPAGKVCSFIRGQTRPYPGAFTFWNKKKITIWKAMVDNKTYFGTPGQVAKITNEGVTVICGGNSSITITEYHGEIKTINTRFV